LEENSLKELEKKNSKYILLEVSDARKASGILKDKFKLKDYAASEDNIIRIYDTAVDLAEVNKALILQEISVNRSQFCNDTLEDYFRKITGGEGIA
ncbi:MAG: ABC transporter ATP-binding protein, partial [Lachnospiraceae bacterium]|nr:ABC transporter ATP-binding protein [Lachnospiraceae bacterium]